MTGIDSGESSVPGSIHHSSAPSRGGPTIPDSPRRTSMDAVTDMPSPRQLPSAAEHRKDQPGLLEIPGIEESDEQTYRVFLMADPVTVRILLPHLSLPVRHRHVKGISAEAGYTGDSRAFPGTGFSPR